MEENKIPVTEEKAEAQEMPVADTSETNVSAEEVSQTTEPETATEVSTDSAEEVFNPFGFQKKAKEATEESLNEDETEKITPVPSVEKADPVKPLNTPSSAVNGFALASMILGIIAVTLCAGSSQGIILGVISLVFAIISSSQVGRMNGMAKAGMICGIAGISLTVLYIVAFVLCYVVFFVLMMLMALMSGAGGTSDEIYNIVAVLANRI